MLTGRPQRPKSSEPEAISLYCSAELKLPLEEIVESFQRRTGIRVRVNYNSDHLLFDRLAIDRPDLFLAAGDFYVNQAKAMNLTETIHQVAGLEPVILVNDDNHHNIQGVADLAAPQIRLGLGDKDSAIGKITEQIFHKSDIDVDKIRSSTHISAFTSGELARYVELGRVDAAIVWQPAARQYHHRTRIINIPSELNIVSSVNVAIIKDSSEKETAGQFIEFLRGNMAKDIFEKYDYIRYNANTTPLSR